MTDFMGACYRIFTFFFVFCGVFYVIQCYSYFLIGDSDFHAFFLWTLHGSIAVAVAVAGVGVGVVVAVAVAVVVAVVVQLIQIEVASKPAGHPVRFLFDFPPS
jgi:hypothetical protein